MSQYHPQRSNGNFTNILRAAFTLIDTESVKKIHISHQHLFTIFGSSGEKAVHKTLMKLTLMAGIIIPVQWAAPVVNFINILLTNFL